MASSLYNLAVVAADHRRCGGLTLSGRAGEPAASELFCGGRPQQDCIDVTLPSSVEGHREPMGDGSLECARVTDKALGEPELSRPMARAAPTPSKGMCALHVCRCAVA